MRAPRLQILLLAATVGAMALAGGSPPSSVGGQPAGMVKVDQGFADVGPLQADMRLAPLDLRMPTDYDAVYRGMAANGYGGSTEYFARISGAVTAVFPQSVYLQLKDGSHVADVPPGTVYYIGDLPEELTGSPAPEPLPITARRPTRVGSSPDSLTELPFDARIEGISAQRRADIAAELIRRAAEAEKAHLHH